MKKLILFLLIATTVSATTLTGTLNGPDGNGINGTLYMSLSQQAALLSTGGCGGPVEIVPGVLGPKDGYTIAIKVVNGAMQSPPAIYGNDCMLPGGLYYNVALVDNNGNTYFTDKWQIVGSSIDVGTIVSVVISGTTQTLGSTGFVQLIPAGTQIINQPPGTYLGVNTMAVTGTLTLPDGSQCTNNGCLTSNTVTLTGSQTISGVKTFANGIIGNNLLSNIGTAAGAFQNGYFDGVMAVGAAVDVYAPQTGTSYIHNYFPSSNHYALQMFVGGSDLAGGGTQVGPAIFDYTPGVLGASVLTMGGSMNPGNVSYNLGTASLPWNNIFGVDVTATGTLTMGPVGNFYNRVFSGANVTCTGVNDGWQGVRTDTQQEQFCIGGVVYGISLSPL